MTEEHGSEIENSLDQFLIMLMKTTHLNDTIPPKILTHRLKFFNPGDLKGLKANLSNESFPLILPIAYFKIQSFENSKIVANWGNILCSFLQPTGCIQMHRIQSNWASHIWTCWIRQQSVHTIMYLELGQLLQLMDYTHYTLHTRNTWNSQISNMNWISKEKQMFSGEKIYLRGEMFQILRDLLMFF